MSQPDWCAACGKPRIRADKVDAVRRDMQRRHPDWGRFRSYPCPAGGGFHLTTSRRMKSNGSGKPKRGKGRGLAPEKGRRRRGR